MSMQSPLFIARFHVRRTEDGGPVQGFFSFPESGKRNVPSRFDDSCNMATIAIGYEPNARVENGESFEAGCRVLDQPYWAQHVHVGLRFWIWDGRDIIDAEVLRLCPEHWEVPLSGCA
jgi:hypothetical protein